MSDHSDKTQPRPPDKSRLHQHLEQQNPATTTPTPPERRADEPNLGDIVADSMRTMTELIEKLGVGINQLQDDFDSQIKSANKDNETIDALHRELESYRQDLALKVLRPLINDLVALHDDIGQMLYVYGADQPDAVAAVLGDVEGIRNDIESIIERYGFELFLAPERHFHKALQRVHRVVPTADPEQDYLVARRVKRGVRYGERVVRPELVEIYRYRGSLGRMDDDA